MIIAGAGGHALEVFDLLNAEQANKVSFFDNVTPNLPPTLFGRPIITDDAKLAASLQIDSRFVIATGKPLVRKLLHGHLLNLGGIPITIAASSAQVSRNNTNVGEGANIMAFVLISAGVTLGKGSLVNARAHIHHQVSVGDFCEIGPGALLLGNIKVGHQTMIGAGAIILPHVIIGNECKIGAGSVVTKNVPAGITVKGNPAK